MNVVRAAGGATVKTVAGAADRLRRPLPGIVVLLYHRVGRRSDATVDLPVDLFTRQVEELAGSGRVISLDQAAEELDRPDPPTGERIVVTFDDGTADFVDVALPVLAHHGVAVTLYVATDFVERAIPFPRGEPPATWSALRDATATGLVTIGSHTHSHRVLARVGTDEAGDEVDRSRGLIQDRLGTAADHFAYPKAVLGSPAAERVVRDRFRTAAVAGTRANGYGTTDLHRLARSPVQIGDGMRWFRRKMEGGMALEDRMRAVVDRRRYANRTV